MHAFPERDVNSTIDVIQNRVQLYLDKNYLQ